MSHEPTLLQVTAWEATLRLGTQLAAAREMGITHGHLRNHLLGYADNMGIGHGKIPGAARRSRPSEHALYPLLERILRHQQELDTSLDVINAKLDILLSRPAVVVPPPAPTYRRLADGGRRT